MTLRAGLTFSKDVRAEHQVTTGPVCDNPECSLHRMHVSPHDAQHVSLLGPTDSSTVRVFRHLYRREGDIADYYLCDECAAANVTLKPE